LTPLKTIKKYQTAMLKVLQNDTRCIQTVRLCLLMPSAFIVRSRACARASRKCMNLVSTAKLVTIAAISAASLSACYVVPINQYPQTQTPAVIAPAAPTQMVLTARLYPANDLAAPYGMLSGSVTNHLNGRGEIVVVQADELYRGEATRDVNNPRSGTANGVGNKGGYMNCGYTLNNQTQGTGTCKFSNGALYRFHLGS
jgi:hypothetical protein